MVSVGYTEQDTLLALGVSPAGTREFLGGYDYKSRPWAQKALGGEGDAGDRLAEEINFEAVAAQRPDLIIALNSGMTEGDYKRLSQASRRRSRRAASSSTTGCRGTRRRR